MSAIILEVSFNTLEENAERYLAYLELLGATSVTLQDNEAEPLYEPPLNTTPLWKKTHLSALFTTDFDRETIKDFLSEQLDPETFATLNLTPVAEKNWLDAWKEHFSPMRFGKNLMVLAHDTPIDDPNIIPLFLDPGMAFGTGTHPTTHLCLEWLANNPPTDAQVMDYGSGSGILGIAALKLGAKFVTAIDHDPQAIFSTQENAARNGYGTDQITALLPEKLDPLQKADVILANILLNPLLELRDTFSKQLDPKGSLVLAGILSDQKISLIQHYEPFFKLQAATEKDGWVRLVFTSIFL